jgi:GR25 family glycosyltransferase involved in LPS biosynthesis
MQEPGHVPASPVLFLSPSVIVLKDVVTLVADMGRLLDAADALLLGPEGDKYAVVLMLPRDSSSSSRSDGQTLVYIQDLSVQDDAGMDTPASAFFVAARGASRVAETARAAAIVTDRVRQQQRQNQNQQQGPCERGGALAPEGPRFMAIQLSGRPERVRHVDAMRRLLPSLEVVEAIDGAAELDGAALRSLVSSGFVLPGSTDDAYVVPRRPILVNNVAAFLSHRRALARVADGTRVGVVLEDDVELLGDFLEAARVATEAMLADPEGVEFVQLYVMPDQLAVVRPKAWTPRRHILAGDGHGRNGRESRLWSLVPKPTYSWGLHAYAVSPAGAAKLLAHLWPMLGAVDEQLPRLSGSAVAMHVLFDERGGAAVLRESTSAPSVTNETTTRSTVEEVLSMV